MRTTKQIIQALKRKQGKDSLRGLARRIGISAPYLCDIYYGRRQPGPTVLRFLGLRVVKVTTTKRTYKGLR